MNRISYHIVITEQAQHYYLQPKFTLLHLHTQALDVREDMSKLKRDVSNLKQEMISLLQALESKIEAIADFNH